MANDDDTDNGTQKTPAGHEIPVPERDAVIRGLMKAAPPVKPPAEPVEPEDDKS